VDERLLSPSKITVWLDCALSDVARTGGRRSAEGRSPDISGALRNCSWRRGEHEIDCLEEYQSSGPTAFEVPGVVS
jgi:hypothetical protein